MCVLGGVAVMGSISPYFDRQEFACKCGCGFSAVDVELLEVLHLVRLKFGAAVMISSACRCKSHNESVGGSTGSKHMLGIAADIVVRGVAPSDVYEYLDDEWPDSLGIGRYSTFTHVDVRAIKARW